MRCYASTFRNFCDTHRADAAAAVVAVEDQVVHVSAMVDLRGNIDNEVISIESQVNIMLKVALRPLWNNRFKRRI